MEEHKNKLCKLIKQNANENRVYISIKDLFLQSKLSTHEFEKALLSLQNENLVFITADIGIGDELYYKVTLLELINFYRRKNFENAIEGIKEMLQVSIEKEDYESAAEYRDMLKDAKKDFKEVTLDAKNGYSTK